MHQVEVGNRHSPAHGVQIGQTLAVFGFGAILLWTATHLLIPALSSLTGYEPIIFWFVIGAVGVFLPLLVIAACMVRAEGLALDRGTWSQRLRFRRMNRGDWGWSLGAVALIGTLVGMVTVVLPHLVGAVNAQPAFMTFEPLTPGRYWLLGLWLPFWLLNIMGEEILWRGVMLPRQEQYFGHNAWLLNVGGWVLFHLAFGPHLLAMMLPIIVVTPYVVQRRKNTWVGVIIHGLLNGPSFLLIAFGVIG